MIPPEEATEDALSSTDEEASPGPVMGPAFEVRCPLLCSRPPSLSCTQYQSCGVSGNVQEMSAELAVGYLGHQEGLSVRDAKLG